MFVLLHMITLQPDRRDQAGALVAALYAAAQGLPGSASCWAAPCLPNLCLNAGHVVWRMTFTTERDALDARLGPHWQAHVAPLLEGSEGATVGYRTIRKGLRGAGPGIWRALVFRVMEHGFPDEVRKLEASLLTMPDHISTIRSWALNPVAFSEGARAYTHVWEQDFDSPGGLTGEYMDHPIHWGWVDGWFDAEMPQYIVDLQLVQTVGAIDGPIIA